jgi:hypothetical protein
MFSKTIVSDSDSIFKFLKVLDLDQILTKPQFNHLLCGLHQMIPEGYKGKISNVKHCHRTSFGRFFSESPWKHDTVESFIRSYVFRWVFNYSIQTGMSVYVLIDDTTCVKTKPSSQAEDVIEGTGWHFSHTAGKSVFGHQFVTVMIKCGKITLPLQTIPYQKGEKSKIELVMEVIQELPQPPGKAYILADNWFTCEKIIKATETTGYEYIGAVKTNRVIFPKGFDSKGLQIQEFARQLTLKDLDLVTIGSQKYYTYTYQGRLKSGNRIVKIVLSWHEKALFKEKALRCFLSREVNYSTKQILNQYSERWSIEIFFRETKQKFGLAKYQLRSLKAIKKLFLMIHVMYIYLIRTSHQTQEKFGNVLEKERIKQKQSIVKFIFNEATSGTELDQIFKALKIA